MGKSKRSKSSKNHKPKKTPKKRAASKTAKKNGKKKLNGFFTAMLAAKKDNAKSFKYNGKTYHAVKRRHLTVYKCK